MFHLPRIGILRGGPSNEYEVSLLSGATVLKTLRNNFADQYTPHDIFIDRSGIWHFDGIETAPHNISHRIDLAWNALHGNYGEDGKIQSFLETHGIPFTGSGSLSSAVGMNKVLSKKVFKDHGIKSPYFREFNSEDIALNLEGIVKNLFESFLLPAIVKPVSSGSSVGVYLIRSYDQLPEALREAAMHSDTVMIEEFIPGVEASCGVVEGFRGQELYALPPIEIRPDSHFFDYEAKYAGKSREIVPATFPDDIKQAIEELAKSIHRVLGLKHYSRSDFIVHPRRGVYALEVNTLPGLTEESLMPKALRAVGSDTHELVGHVIGLVLGRK